jgi:uncharacterized protein
MSLVCVSVLALAGCERGDAVTVMETPNGSRLELPANVQPVVFDVGTARVQANDQTHTLRVEIAETDAQRERGLMYRTSMPQDAGMVFVYPQEIQGGFWMYNTRIPLSIAFADTDGIIFQITEMVPCETDYATLCRTYDARRPFRYALEANQGYFQARGIEPGARLTWERQ